MHKPSGSHLLLKYRPSQLLEPESLQPCLSKQHIKPEYGEQNVETIVGKNKLVNTIVLIAESDGSYDNNDKDPLKCENQNIVHCTNYSSVSSSKQLHKL